MKRDGGKIIKLSPLRASARNGDREPGKSGMDIEN